MQTSRFRERKKPPRKKKRIRIIKHLNIKMGRRINSSPFKKRYRLNQTVEYSLRADSISP